MFWLSMQGPRYDFDPRAEDDGRELKSIAEVVCPECNNVICRLSDAAGGVVELRGWTHADAPGDPNGKSVGWATFALITDSEPRDDEDSESMRCWQGHGGLHFNARMCRDAIANYRSAGRKRRIVALRGA